MENDYKTGLSTGGIFSCLFGPCRAACGTLVPSPRIKPMPPGIGSTSLNHWTARDSQGGIFTTGQIKNRHT